MQYCFLLLLFILVSCSTPNREIASIEVGDIHFPSEAHELKFTSIFMVLENSQLSYLKLLVKNSHDEFVDIDEGFLFIKEGKTPEFIKPTVERVSKGKYYLTLSEENFSDRALPVIYYGDIKISTQLNKANHAQIDFSKSSLKVIEKSVGHYHFELKLNSDNHKKITSQIPPEIILDGRGTLSEVKLSRPGVWHFDLDIPNENQILYLDVQLNGQRSNKLLRLQYVGEY